MNIKSLIGKILKMIFNAGFLASNTFLLLLAFFSCYFIGKSVCVFFLVFLIVELAGIICSVCLYGDFTVHEDFFYHSTPLREIPLPPETLVIQKVLVGRYGTFAFVIENGLPGGKRIYFCFTLENFENAKKFISLARHCPVTVEDFDKKIREAPFIHFPDIYEREKKR